MNDNVEQFMQGFLGLNPSPEITLESFQLTQTDLDEFDIESTWDPLFDMESLDNQLDTAILLDTLSKKIPANPAFESLSGTLGLEGIGTAIVGFGLMAIAAPVVLFMKLVQHIGILINRFIQFLINLVKRVMIFFSANKADQRTKYIKDNIHLIADIAPEATLRLAKVRDLAGLSSAINQYVQSYTKFDQEVDVIRMEIAKDQKTTLDESGKKNLIELETKLVQAKRQALKSVDTSKAIDVNEMNTTDDNGVIEKTAGWAHTTKAIKLLIWENGTPLYQNVSIKEWLEDTKTNMGEFLYTDKNAVMKHLVEIQGMLNKVRNDEKSIDFDKPESYKHISEDEARWMILSIKSVNLRRLVMGQVVGARYTLIIEVLNITGAFEKALKAGLAHRSAA